MASPDAKIERASAIPAKDAGEKSPAAAAGAQSSSPSGAAGSRPGSGGAGTLGAPSAPAATPAASGPDKSFVGPGFGAPGLGIPIGAAAMAHSSPGIEHTVTPPAKEAGEKSFAAVAQDATLPGGVGSGPGSAGPSAFTASVHGGVPSAAPDRAGGSSGTAAMAHSASGGERATAASSKDTREQSSNADKLQGFVPPKGVDYEHPLLHCMATMFRLLGKPVSANVLRSYLPSYEGPLQPAACIRSVRQAGMEARIVLRSSVLDISPLTLPCVLLLKGGSSCVLTALGEEEATVIFPEAGENEQQIPLERLESEFTGYAMFCALQKRLDRRASNIKLLKTEQWFWGTIWGFMPIYKHVIIATLVTNLLVIAAPLFFMNVYDRVVPNNAIETLWVLAVGIIIAYLFDFLLRNLRSYFVDVAGRNADVVLASRLLQHVMGMRLDHKPDSTGTLSNNLREFESLREFFGSSTLLALVDVPFLFIFIAIVYFIGGPLAIIPAIAVPLVTGVGIFLQYPFQRVVESGYREAAQKNALLIEIINGLETVKTSQAEGRMQHLWERVVGMSAASNQRAKRLGSISVTFSMLAAQLVSVGVIIWGVYLIAQGELTMGGLIGCNILAGRAMAPLSQVAGMLSRLQQSRMALKSLDLLMNTPLERSEEQTHFDYSTLRHDIALEQVFFKYPNAERYALEDISLTIRAGERVGIIGRMGSGKSTLGRLTVGLYQPLDGAVKMGGVDIRQLDVADLRARVGFVSQDNYLFYGSLRDNIALGHPNIDDKMILRAATLAGVVDFVQAHPAGFGMPVGERGMALSGGQRQAVAIARALLHDPDILILDEPSSNMDNASETLLKQRIASIIKGKTLILVTHRMSMLDLVDRLVVIEQGKIVADGPKNSVLGALGVERGQSMSRAVKRG